MGVTGLWKLVEQSGKPVPLETLENKVLAVDISIWLHQVIKGFQDSKGSSLPNAHVLGLFHRLCKLMYYRVKPVFVFDGGVPILKKQTIIKRNQSKSKFHNEADRIQQLLLETLAKEKVVQQALGSATSLLVSPTKKVGNSSKEQGEPDEMFKLPPLKDDSPFKSSDEAQTNLDDSTSSWDEKTSKNYYHLNLNAIDVTSVHFKNLPADVRHDILTDIKETRKESSWGRLHELPVESNDFSSFQMKRLLKRRTVQVELEEAEKEMGGKCLSLAELEALLSEEGVDTCSDRAAQKIASDENTRFLLVRDVQKAIEKAKAREEEDKNAPKPAKLAKVEDKKSDVLEILDDKDMDEELQLAIKMSLMQDEDPNVMIDLEPEEVRMSKQQKQVLGGAALSLARGYMLEYGGMSNDDIRELLQQTQDVDCGDVEHSFTQMYEHKDTSVAQNDKLQQDDNVQEILQSSETESDSDFIDVPTDDLDDSAPGVILPLNPSNHLKPLYNTVVDFTLDDLKLNKDKNQVVEVIIDKNKLGQKDEDDIFADVFESTSKGRTIDKLTTITLDEKLTSSTAQKSQSKTIPETVVCVKPAIKIKNVNDINKGLKEELERLKSCPAVIDLDKIDVTDVLEAQAPSVDAQKTEITIPNIKIDEEKTEFNKQLQEERNLPKPNKADVTFSSLEVHSIVSDGEDSDATVGYSPMKEVQKLVQASETGNAQLLQKAITSNADQSDPVYGTPKKGTLEQFVKSRTPGSDSKKSEPEEDLPKVPKPFFVNKTPTSSSKKRSNESERNSSPSKSARVSKELFPEQEPIPSTSKAPIPQATAVSAECLITEMADSLKDNKTPLELKRMALNLAQEERELEKEKNRQNRLGNSITEQMQNDCMELLKLFGVPFIVAPMEAEAQCAFLNQIEITDGTITDDSDIWLFGGKTVYKNFFNQQKLVLEFTIENIERLFQMDRKKLIQLALLVGSDYTTGIHGIGAVTALEILASFPSTPEKEGETSEIMSLLSGLRKFREWWNHGRNSSTGTRITLKSKLKNIEFSEGFPSSGVVEAYLYPTVDGSKEGLSWGYPDVERLLDFAKQKFGWASSKTNDILNPVLKRLDERKSQASIKNYFKVQSAVAYNQVKVSKRVQQAVDVMAGKAPAEPTKSPKKRPSRKKKANDVIVVEDLTSESKEVQNEEANLIEPMKPRGRKPTAGRGKKTASKAQSSIDTDKPSTSLSNISGIIANINDQSAEQLGESIVKNKKLAAKNKIPDFNPAITQRLKDQEEMANRKQRAIELFRKTHADSKSKKSRR
ncbi:DNA excision repair protein ERCC-5 [Sabethes cyaneus]|uniref:DNA excision repair protein ERCC-5 n=1 Tax=Sabethes cyaneus TaxID=53552 RepID=UPI00237E3CBB|nr:DNA excision repair protein ERCC-5 [Sabethes cyaneus]